MEGAAGRFTRSLSAHRLWYAQRPFMWASAPYYGVYGYGNYWYPGYGWVTATAEPKACQKEKLKDAAGKKHEVLACKQGDGTVKIYEPGVK